MKNVLEFCFELNDEIPQRKIIQKIIVYLQGNAIIDGEWRTNMDASKRKKRTDGKKERTKIKEERNRQKERGKNWKREEG